MSTTGTVNYYELLGVDRNATAEEIKQAYRKQIAVAHPDNGAQGTALFRLVQEAYETLRDPVRRAAYDATLDRPGGAQSGPKPGQPSDSTRRPPPPPPRQEQRRPPPPPPPRGPQPGPQGHRPPPPPPGGNQDGPRPGPQPGPGSQQAPPRQAPPRQSPPHNGYQPPTPPYPPNPGPTSHATPAASAAPTQPAIPRAARTAVLWYRIALGAVVVLGLNGTMTGALDASAWWWALAVPLVGGALAKSKTPPNPGWVVIGTAGVAIQSAAWALVALTSRSVETRMQVAGIVGYAFVFLAAAVTIAVTAFAWRRAARPTHDTDPVPHRT